MAQRIDVRLWRDGFLIVVIVRPGPFRQRVDDVVERRDFFRRQALLALRVALRQQLGKFGQGQPFFGDQPVLDQLRRFGGKFLVPEDRRHDDPTVPNEIHLARLHRHQQPAHVLAKLWFRTASVARQPGVRQQRLAAGDRFGIARLDHLTQRTYIAVETLDHHAFQGIDAGLFAQGAQQTLFIQHQAAQCVVGALFPSIAKQMDDEKQRVRRSFRIVRAVLVGLQHLQESRRRLLPMT